MDKKSSNKFVGVRLPAALVERLHWEAARRGEQIREVTEMALIAYLPELRIVVTKPGHRENSREVSGATRG